MSPDSDETDEARIAITRAELVMLVVLVMLGVGVWAWVDAQVASYTRHREPREERVLLAHDLRQLEAELNLTREEHKQTGEQLIKARLEFYRHEAALTPGAAQATPTPATTPAPTPSPRRTPSPASTPAGDTAAGAAAADTQAGAGPTPPATNAAARDASDRHVKLLGAELVKLQDKADSLALRVEEARAKAAAEFGREQVWHRLRRPAITLGVTTLLTLLMTGALLLAWRVARGGRGGAGALRPHVPTLAWLLCGLLCVLYFYQAFDIAGAAFAGAFVLIVYLARAPWEARRAG